MEQWHPDAILYVVDSRQALHFKNLFEAVRRWGYDKVALEHISFGSVLGPDRKPIKTREGGAVELGALLDEAVERAAQVYQQTREERLARGDDVPELGPDELRQVVEAVGLGAVKYADLSQNRDNRLCLQLGQDAGDGRQHGNLHAVCLRPYPRHLSQGR